MRIITKKKEDEIIKASMQLTTIILGKRLSQEEVELCADCMFSILFNSTGKRGGTEMMESLLQQTKLHMEMLIEQIKTRADHPEEA